MIYLPSFTHSEMSPHKSRDFRTFCLPLYQQYLEHSGIQPIFGGVMKEPVKYQLFALHSTMWSISLTAHLIPYNILITAIIQMWKLRLGEVKLLAQDHSLNWYHMLAHLYLCYESSIWAIFLLFTRPCIDSTGNNEKEL